MRKRYRLVTQYVARAYLASFLAAFCFFFFIFFVNQLLLLVQHILVKNVSLKAVLQLVSLAIPQFLLYTFPFSSLTASAMVIGDLSSNNEILALRSSGFPLRRIFLPILCLSLLVAGMTFATANVLLPRSHIRYRKLYAELMRDLPTMELESWSSNTIAGHVIANGQAEASRVENLVVMRTDTGQPQVVTARSAHISLDDPASFVYRLDLEEPELTFWDASMSAVSSAKKGTMYLDFSSQVPEAANTKPSQLSLHDLNKKISAYQLDLDAQWDRHEQELGAIEDRGSRLLEEGSDAQEYNELLQERKEAYDDEPLGFYLQYFRAEKHKKLALSMACFLLVFLTFPMAYLKLKHGRLIGFGVAMLASVAYWYLLFFSQISIYRTNVNPMFLMWGPDVFLFILALLALGRVRR